MPDWLELEGPTTTGQQGLAWRFTIRTDRPGSLHASLAFECDTGVGNCSISLTVRDGQPALGDLALCDSPFDCQTSHESLRPLVRILNALPFRVHCLDSLGELGGLRPRTLVLHRAGLLRCAEGDVAAVERLVAGGTNLLVLADEFYRGTTGAANRILAPFGLRLKQDGTGEPGISQEERVRRILDWQARYDRVPLDSGPAEICRHRLTEGVRRVHWFRPCPVVCVGPASLPLVLSPAGGGECFAAVSDLKGYVVAVGKSLFSKFSSVGWPYDNDRLLANILVGGDAEANIGSGGPV